MINLEQTIVKAKPITWKQDSTKDDDIIGIIVNHNSVLQLYPIITNDNHASISDISIIIDTETIREWTGMYDRKQKPAFDNDMVCTEDGAIGKIAKYDFDDAYKCKYEVVFEKGNSIPLEIINFTIIDDMSQKDKYIQEALNSYTPCDDEIISDDEIM